VVLQLQKINIHNRYVWRVVNVQGYSALSLIGNLMFEKAGTTTIQKCIVYAFECYSNMSLGMMAIFRPK